MGKPKEKGAGKQRIVHAEGGGLSKCLTDACALTSESSQALGTLAKVSIRRNNKLRSPSWTFVANFIKEKTRSLWCASIADLPTKSFQEKG